MTIQSFGLRLLNLLCLIVVWVPATSFSSDIFVPWFLRESGITTPSAAVPENCAAFFSSTGWAGMWNREQYTEIWISEINEDCSAKVYLVHDRDNSKSLGYEVLQDTKIKRNTLSFDAAQGSAKVKGTLKLKKNGEMFGSWRNLDRGNNVRGEFKKRPTGRPEISVHEQ